MTQALRIGVAGLGRAFTLMLPTFIGDERVRLVAAADPLAQARTQFERDFQSPTYPSVEALCADPAVQVVYVATPHQFHAEHVQMAAAHGKHVLVEKPMAITLAQCTAMIEATQAANVAMVVGHSHSFNGPILHTRALIESGAFGAVRMMTALNFTDFLFRPRRPEELVTEAGGGVIHSQATHQIDILRLLGGGRVRSVMAHTGAWDPTRPTEGAYQALLAFEGGAFASATYSGYGHFDSDVWMDQIGEMGQAKSPQDHGAARKRLADLDAATQESTLKARRNYGGDLYRAPPPNVANDHQHFGPLIVSCEKADLRPTATGVEIFTDRERRFDPLPRPAVPRSEVIDELIDVVQGGKPALHSGAWARATTEVCLAILASAREGQAQALQLQIGVPKH
ncbi:MAG: Gfo/Idh/MocA family oxidoreductase [Burkholderiaceae bacterium]